MGRKVAGLSSAVRNKIAELQSKYSITRLPFGSGFFSLETNKRGVTDALKRRINMVNSINNTFQSLERTEARNPARKDASKTLDKTTGNLEQLNANNTETAIDQTDKVKIASKRSEAMGSNKATLTDHDEALKLLEDIKTSLYEEAEAQNQNPSQVHNLNAENLTGVL